MNKTKVSRFLLAVILSIVVAFGVMACVDNTPDDNTDETTYKIEVTCDTEQGSYKLEPAKDAYKKGDEVTLTVTPKSDYELDKVTIDGKTATANSNGSYTITVGEANVKVNITFKTKGDVPPAPSTYEVTVNCDEEKATVAFEEEGPYEEGEEVKFTVTPIGENKIKSVKFNGTELEADEDDKYTIIIAKENVIDVEFESDEPPVSQYTVDVQYNGDQGEVTWEPNKETYEENEEVVLTVTPNDGLVVDAVTKDGEPLTAEDDGTYKFNVDGEVKIEVTFKLYVAPPAFNVNDWLGKWISDTKDHTVIITESNVKNSIHVKTEVSMGVGIDVDFTYNEEKEWFENNIVAEETGYIIYKTNENTLHYAEGYVKSITGATVNDIFLGPWERDCIKEGTEPTPPPSGDTDPTHYVGDWEDKNGATITITNNNGTLHIDFKNGLEADLTLTDGVFKYTGAPYSYEVTLADDVLTVASIDGMGYKTETTYTKKEAQKDGPESDLWTGEGTGTSTDPYIIKELNGTIKFHHVSAGTKPYFRLQGFEYDTEYKIVSATSSDSSNPKGGERVQFFKNGTVFRLGYIGPKGNEHEDPETIIFVRENGDENNNKFVIEESDYILFTVNNNSLGECDITWVFEKVEKEPEPSDNLWTGSGDGTQTNPFIISGLNGTITAPHTGLKDPNGTPGDYSNNTNNQDWYKWENPVPGEYKLISIIAEHMTGSTNGLVLYHDGQTAANKVGGNHYPANDAIITIEEGWSVIYLKTTYRLNYNENIIIVFEKQGGDEPVEPVVDNTADDFVGSWKREESLIPGQSQTLTLTITKTSETEVNGELFVNGSSAQKFKFVKGDDKVWKDVNSDYTVKVEEGKLYLEEKVGSSVDSKEFEKDEEQPPEPSGNLWTGSGDGTQTNPFIISGLNGTITAPHTGLKDPNGTPGDYSNNTNNQDWYKWENPVPGEYKLISITAEHMTGSTNGLVLYHDGQTAANKVGGNHYPANDAIITIQEGWSVIYLKTTYRLNYNENIIIVFEKQGGDEPVEPVVDNKADDFVGNWKREDPLTAGQSQTLTLTITKTSETEVNGELFVNGSSAQKFKFVKGDDKIWKDESSNYTVKVEEGKLYLEEKVGSSVDSKEFEKDDDPGEVIDIPEKFHGKWTGNEYSFDITNSSFEFYYKDSHSLTGTLTEFSDFSANETYIHFTYGPLSINVYLKINQSNPNNMDLYEEFSEIDWETATVYETLTKENTEVPPEPEQGIPFTVQVLVNNVETPAAATYEITPIKTKYNTDDEVTIKITPAADYEIIGFSASSINTAGTSGYVRVTKDNTQANTWKFTVGDLTDITGYTLKITAASTLIPEKFWGKFTNVVGKIQSTKSEYAEGDIVIEVTEREFKLTYKGEVQALTDVKPTLYDNFMNYFDGKEYIIFKWTNSENTSALYFGIDGKSNSETKGEFILTATNSFSTGLVFKKDTGEQPPAPSGNLIVSGTGTQADPYVLSGLNGTITFNYPGNYQKVYFKLDVAKIKLGTKYEFVSCTSEKINKVGFMNGISLIQGVVTPKGVDGQYDYIIFTGLDGVESISVTTRSNDSVAAEVTWVFAEEGGGSSVEPAVENNADDFVGNWKSSNPTGYTLKITKTSETEISGELFVSGSSAQEFKFVKGSDKVWKDTIETDDRFRYSVRVENGKLYLNNVSDMEFEKDEDAPVEPSVDINAYLGQWYGNGKNEATVAKGEEELTLTITVNMNGTPIGPIPLTYNKEKGYFENSGDADTGSYTLKLEGSNLVFSISGNFMNESFTFTRNKPSESEGELFGSSYIGKYINNGKGKLNQQEYAEKTVELEVTANAISIKLNGVAQHIESLEKTTDSYNDLCYSFMWKELNATCYLAKVPGQLSNGNAVIGIFQSKAIAAGIFFIREGSEPTPPVEQERKIEEKYYGTYVATKNSDTFYADFENASILITADGVEFFYNSKKQTISKVRMDDDDGMEYIHFFWDNCPWATTDANKHFYIMTLSGKAPQRAFILYESTASMKHPLNFAEGDLIVVPDDTVYDSYVGTWQGANVKLIIEKDSDGKLIVDIYEFDFDNVYSEDVEFIYNFQNDRFERKTSLGKIYFIKLNGDTITYSEGVDDDAWVQSDLKKAA